MSWSGRIHILWAHRRSCSRPRHGGGQTTSERKVPGSKLGGWLPRTRKRDGRRTPDPLPRTGEHLRVPALAAGRPPWPGRTPPCSTTTPQPWPGRRSRPTPAHLSVEGAPVPRVARRRRGGRRPAHHAGGAGLGRARLPHPPAGRRQTRPAHRQQRPGRGRRLLHPPRPGRRERHPRRSPQVRATRPEQADGGTVPARGRAAPIPARPGPRPHPVLRWRLHRRDRRPGRP